MWSATHTLSYTHIHTYTHTLIHTHTYIHTNMECTPMFLAGSIALCRFFCLARLLARSACLSLTHIFAVPFSLSFARVRTLSLSQLSPLPPASSPTQVNKLAPSNFTLSFSNTHTHPNTLSHLMMGLLLRVSSDRWISASPPCSE